LSRFRHLSAKNLIFQNNARLMGKDLEHIEPHGRRLLLPEIPVYQRYDLLIAYQGQQNYGGTQRHAYFRKKLPERFIAALSVIDPTFFDNVPEHRRL
jgi:hypothetical protein